MQTRLGHMTKAWQNVIIWLQKANNSRNILKGRIWECRDCEHNNYLQSLGSRIFVFEPCFKLLKFSGKMSRFITLLVMWTSGFCVQSTLWTGMTGRVKFGTHPLPVDVSILLLPMSVLSNESFLNQGPSCCNVFATPVIKDCPSISHFWSYNKLFQSNKYSNKISSVSSTYGNLARSSSYINIIK